MPRYFPNLDEFDAMAKQADLVPVYRQLLADHLTPVTAFELLGRQEHALLLESVVGNAAHLSGEERQSRHPQDRLAN
jgi:anthranilate synthase component 1